MVLNQSQASVTRYVSRLPGDTDYPRNVRMRIERRLQSDETVILLERRSKCHLPRCHPIASSAYHRERGFMPANFTVCKVLKKFASYLIRKTWNRLNADISLTDGWMETRYFAVWFAARQDRPVETIQLKFFSLKVSHVTGAQITLRCR